MKVQNKFFMMSTSLMLALVATSVHADEHNKLARQEKRLANSAEKIRNGDQGEMGRYAKRLRKVNETRDDLGIRRVKSDDQRLFGIDPANSTTSSSSVTVTTTTITYSGDGSVNVRNNSGNPGQGNTVVKHEAFALPASGQCGYGYYPVAEIGMCVPMEEVKEGPCNTKGDPGQGNPDKSNPGQGDPGQGNPGQGNPGQGNALNCAADPNSIPSADNKSCVCKDGYEKDPSTKLCAEKKVTAQSCEDQGKITDPDTGDCLDVPPPPKPVVNKKPVRNKKPVEKKPVEKKPVEKKPVQKKPVQKKPVQKKPEVKKPEVKTPCEIDPCEAKLLKEKNEHLQIENNLLNQQNVQQKTITDLHDQIADLKLEDKKNESKGDVKIGLDDKFKATYWNSNAVIGGSKDKIKSKYNFTFTGKDVRVSDASKMNDNAIENHQKWTQSIDTLKQKYGIKPVLTTGAQ
ncbi:MAG: hypothetical protein JST04_11695 [Bdellovibrionales bacterium]|nr:hypothetical protein [Bdellovibrionales bacterium]